MCARAGALLKGHARTGSSFIRTDAANRAQLARRRSEGRAELAGWTGIAAGARRACGVLPRDARQTYSTRRDVRICTREAVGAAMRKPGGRVFDDALGQRGVEEGPRDFSARLACVGPKGTLAERTLKGTTLALAKDALGHYVGQALETERRGGAAHVGRAGEARRRRMQLGAAVAAACVH